MNDGVDWRCDDCDVTYKNCGGGDLLECKKGWTFGSLACKLHIVRHADELSVSSTLAQRGATHGDYGASTHFIQHLRTCFREAPSWTGHDGHVMNDAQRQSLDEIAAKLGRLLYGDPHFPEHWHDIGGYAKLGEQACKT